MCGIVAYLSPNAAEHRSITGRLLGRLRHRGESHLQNETKQFAWGALGCNRLAIMSGDMSPQPIQSSDGTITAVYNGEVYNHRTIAVRNGIGVKRLQGGDGTVIVDFLEREGLRALRELDGMFALVWYDSRDHVLHFARDRCGIKPLYYAQQGDDIYIASELKALAPENAIRDINEARPGCVYSLALGSLGTRSLKEERFASFEQEKSDEPCSITDLGRVIEQSVEACCDCKHQIGVYLSGGMDSSAVFAIASRLGRRPIALTLAGRGGVDSPHAVALAKDLGEDLVKSHVPDETELFERLDETIAIVESFEPNVVRQSSVQYYISELARRAGVKVVLCGEGADELFCGYPEFVDAKNGWESLRSGFLKDLHRTQLQRVDRMSMQFTTEVRVPYLLNSVVDLALASRRYNDCVTESASRVTVKACLRSALVGILPDRWRLRAKVVLSEGVGLGGNDPAKGMFARLANERMTAAGLREVQSEFAEWGIKSPEEAIYFLRFHELGYTKAGCLRDRAIANQMHSRMH